MKLHKKVLIGLALLIGGLPLTVLAPSTVNAAPNFNLAFSNESILQGSVSGQTFQVSSSLSPGSVPSTTVLQYKNIIQTGPLCLGTNIQVVASVAKSGSGQTNSQSVIKYKPAGSNNCQTYTGSSPIGSPSNPAPAAKIDWTGAKGVLSSDGNTVTVTFSDNSTLDFTNTGATSGNLTFKPQNTGNAINVGGAAIASWCSNTSYSDSSGNPYPPSQSPNMGIVMSSYTDSTGSVDVCYDTGSGGSTNQSSITIPVDTSAYAAAQTGQQDDSGTAPTCEASGASLSWIMCPIVNGLADGVGLLYSNLIQPLLRTSPIDFSSTNDPTSTYAIWSEFRVYGDIFLVIALLVIVFGESIGGGLIDAYSAKKILPRLLIAAVLINLSIYFVALAVDFTNILGNGLEALIEIPFKNVGAFHIHINGFSDVGIPALFGTAGIIWAFKAKLGAALLEVFGFCIVLPAFLTFIAILFTVILRRGLILFLILISPIAFALYCLPNTEQYFRRWWDLLIKTLLVYPIIAVAFAMGNVLSVTMNSTTGGLGAGLSEAVAVIALFVPLILIPYSFRIAGGILGRAHEAITGVRDQVHKATEGRRQLARTNMYRARIQGQQDAAARLKAQASKGGAIRRRGFSFLANAAGGFSNIEARASAVRAEVAKEANDTIATGADGQWRGLTVDKATSARRVNDGKVQYQSLGGGWVDEADVDEGHRRFGGNAWALQAALAYEMRKANSEEDVQRIASGFSGIAQANGLTDQQAGGIWIGAAFEHQNQHLEYKYTDWKTGQLRGDQGREGLVSETFEKRGAYNMAQMHANTIESLSSAYDEDGLDIKAADRILASPATATAADRARLGIGTAATGADVVRIATERRAEADSRQNRTASIAETFMNRYGGGAVGGEDAELAARVDAERTRGGRPVEPTVQTNTPGSAHTAEEVRKLAVKTGVYRPLSRSTDSGPAIPRQN